MRIVKTKDVKTPERASDMDAGIDFFVPNEFGEHIIPVKGSIVIPSGIKAAVPPNFALIAFNKSGIAVGRKLQVGACVVDESYQGEIHLHLFNVGDKAVRISPRDKIVQFVLIPVSYQGIEVVKDGTLYKTETKRGAGWKGSTNK